MKKIILFLSLILYASNLLASTKYDGELRLYQTSDPKSFNPIIAQETSTTAVTGFIFESLLKTDPFTLEMKPLLASNWKKEKNGLVWIFTLRKNIKWNDGKNFTADDVIFTFNKLIYNKNIPTSLRDILSIRGKQIKVEKIDDYTVKFTLPSPFAPFLRTAGSVEILPKHKYEKYVNENTFHLAMSLDSKPTDIVGTGPFMIEKYNPGQSVILKRNPNYWKKNGKEKLPYLKRIVISIMNDDVALMQFRQNNIDIYSVRGFDYPILKPLEKTNGFKIYNLGPSFGSNFITFNLNTDKKQDGTFYIDEKKLKLFRKKEFRKAISYAIDKEFIIDSVFNGFAEIQYSPISPANKIFYNPKAKEKYPYEYNPEKAKELLKKCGLKDTNKDGYLEYEDGSAVEFNLYTNSGVKEREKICEIIRKDLENVGLKVNYRLLEFNYIVEKSLKTYDWDSIVLGFTGGIDPHFGANVWKSSGHLHIWHPKQKKPDFEFEKQIDEIFDKAVEIMSDKKRKPLYDKWQMIAADNLPLIYTVIPERLIAVNNRLKNIKPSSYQGVLHNIEEIYIEGQKND